MYVCFSLSSHSVVVGVGDLYVYVCVCLCVHPICTSILTHITTHVIVGTHETIMCAVMSPTGRYMATCGSGQVVQVCLMWSMSIYM